MMLRSQMERLEIKSPDCSLRRRRTLVSYTIQTPPLASTKTNVDVIVLTSMGEQVAIEAKEAPRGN